MNEPRAKNREMWVVTFYGGWGLYLVVTDRVERAIMLAKKDLRKHTDADPHVETIERLRYRIIMDDR